MKVPADIAHSPSSPADEQQVLRSLFSALSDAILVAGTDGRIVMANPAAGKLFGYTTEELTRLNVDDLVPDAIRHRHAAYRRSYEDNPRPRPMGTHMELVARRADGSEVMVEIALSPLQNHGLPYVVAGIRDISAYPRMKQALRRARYSEHLAHWGRMAVDTRDVQAMIEQTPGTAVDALQLDGAELLLLEPGEQSFRLAANKGPWQKDSAQSMPARTDAMPGYVFAQAAPVVIADIQAEQRFSMPPRYLASGYTSALIVPVLDRRRVVGMLAVCSKALFTFGDDEVRFLQSLSDLLTTTLQRAQSEEALNHAQRLESVGQLTGGIAHDFNNLLTVIQGNLQVLEELPRMASDEGAQDLLAAAARASKRAAELTRKLLAFSRRQVLQPAAVDVGAMLNSLADMLRRTLDQRILIEVDAPPDCPQVSADPGQLESALLNIAINARDAMPNGGTLRFSASVRDTLPAEALTTLDDVGAACGFVAISIADTGTGMSDEVKERAFEPFFTTKEAGRGTGLGLSTVYGFVKQSRGAIGIDSALGKGCVLTLYIPQLTDADPQPAEHARHAADLPRGLRILLVEDDAEVRTTVKRYLTDLGCEVSEVGSAEEALKALEQTPALDILLSDIALGPGMRGTELAALVQQRMPSLRVLLMSGYSADLLEADRVAPPAWELLRKPYSREELAAAISRVLNAG